jgi:chromosome segregation ATPase
MAEKRYYIYNGHNAPISANARDEKGKVRYTKTFMPERRDPTTGRVESTGYKELTKEEYEDLRNTSKVFNHYVDDLKLLKVCDDLPAAAKTPHEALVSAREESQRRARELEAAQGEVKNLKTQLFDLDQRYQTLVSASSPDEILKPLKGQVEALTKKSAALSKLDAELVVEITKLAGNQQDVKRILDGHAKKVSALDKPADAS